MNINKEQLFIIGGIIFSALTFNWALHNPNLVLNFAGALGSLLTPFILGGAIAFIINIPMRAIENHLPQTPVLKKVKRPLAWLITFALFAIVIALAINIIIPQLIVSLQAISAHAIEIFRDADEILSMVPSYITTLVPELEQDLKELSLNVSSITNKLTDMLQNVHELFRSGYNLINSLISMIFTLFVAFFFSIYLLFDKEHLARQGKQIIYALLKPQTADKTMRVLRLANKTFKNFITGQCTEACILALMFFVAMCITGLPYATLISAVIGITALIPIFGAFIGCVFGGLLLILNSPMQLVGFLVLFLVLQQIEGNLIYPRVVGGKVGLPAIWVLVAITVGGGLFGVLGMLMFIPLCSVAYAVFAEYVKERLAQQQVPPSKWQN